jgi:hypothetical protein
MTNLAAPLRAMVLEDPVRGHDSPVFIRGEAGNRGEVVPRRFLQLLSGRTVRPVWTNGSGRLELALAIASKQQSAHGPRDDQPHLAAPFWRGHRAHAG